MGDNLIGNVFQQLLAIFLPKHLMVIIHTDVDAATTGSSSGISLNLMGYLQGYLMGL